MGRAPSLTIHPKTCRVVSAKPVSARSIKPQSNRDARYGGPKERSEDHRDRNPD